MSDDQDERWSDEEGPECPSCHRRFTADDPEFFDDKGFEMECYECRIVFHVQPYTSTSWTTKRLKPDQPAL